MKARWNAVAQDETESVDTSRENRFAVNALASVSGGWDVPERDGRGRRETGLDGKELDGMERDGTERGGTGRGDREGTG